MNFSNKAFSIALVIATALSIQAMEKPSDWVQEETKKEAAFQEQNSHEQAATDGLAMMGGTGLKSTSRSFPAGIGGIVSDYCGQYTPELEVVASFYVEDMPFNLSFCKSSLLKDELVVTKSGDIAVIDPQNGNILRALKKEYYTPNNMCVGLNNGVVVGLQNSISTINVWDEQTKLTKIKCGLYQTLHAIVSCGNSFFLMTDESHPYEKINIGNNQLSMYCFKTLGPDSVWAVQDKNRNLNALARIDEKYFFFDQDCFSGKKEKPTVLKIDGNVRCINCDNAGNPYFVTARQNSIKIVDEQGNCQQSIDINGPLKSCLACGPNKIAVQNTQAIKVYDITTGECLGTIDGKVNCFAVNNEGTLLATLAQDSNQITVWEIPSSMTVKDLVVQHNNACDLIKKGELSLEEALKCAQQEVDLKQKSARKVRKFESLEQLQKTYIDELSKEYATIMQIFYDITQTTPQEFEAAKNAMEEQLKKAWLDEKKALIERAQKIKYDAKYDEFRKTTTGLIQNLLRENNLNPDDIAVIFDDGSIGADLNGKSPGYYMAVNPFYIMVEIARCYNDQEGILQNAIMHEITHLVHHDLLMRSVFEQILKSKNPTLCDSFIQLFNLFKEKRADIKAWMLSKTHAVSAVQDYAQAYAHHRCIYDTTHQSSANRLAIAEQILDEMRQLPRHASEYLTNQSQDQKDNSTN